MKASSIVALLASVCLAGATPLPDGGDSPVNKEGYTCTPRVGPALNKNDTTAAIDSIPTKGNLSLTSGKCKVVACQGHTEVRVCNYKKDGVYEQNSFHWKRIAALAEDTFTACEKKNPDDPTGQGYYTRDGYAYMYVFLERSANVCK